MKTINDYYSADRKDLPKNNHAVECAFFGTLYGTSDVFKNLYDFKKSINFSST